MITMLEAENGGNMIWTYVLIGVIVLMLIALPILMNQRNKRESQKIQEQTNSLKVGDKILTTSGIYGTITEVKYDDSQKLIVIETGGKEKSYLSIDAYAVYTVFKSEEELAREAEEKANAQRLAEEEKEAKKGKKKEQTDEKTVEETKNETNNDDAKKE